MWYRFEEDSPIGIPRIKGYQLAFYDMKNGGDCFDESFFSPNEIDVVISYVETIEDINNSDRCRVFAHFDNGDTYELKLEKIDKERRCSNFYEK